MSQIQEGIVVGSKNKLALLHRRHRNLHKLDGPLSVQFAYNLEAEIYHMYNRLLNFVESLDDEASAV